MSRYCRSQCLGIRRCGRVGKGLQLAWQGRADGRAETGQNQPIDRRLTKCLGKEFGAAGREKWRDDEARARDRRAECRGGRAGRLRIDRQPSCIEAALSQRACQIAAQMLPVQMQDFALWSGRQDQCRQIIHCACGRFRREPYVLGDLGRPIPNAERRHVAPGRQGRKAFYSVARGECQGTDTGQVQRHLKRYDLLQGSDHHLDLAVKPGGKPFGDLGRTHQKQQGGGIVRHGPECYLRSHALATKPIMTTPLTLLGLESSCDDTAAAVLRDDGTPRVMASVVWGQADLHADFGGVVPEIAARAHAERLDHLVEQALAEAGVTLSEIDAIAVTAGPGLIGGVLSGVMAAKGLAFGLGKPLIGVNHLAGHALTPRLTDGLAYPYLMLLVSGGHCQFLRVDGPEDFSRLGGTIDDAPGEAFDKIARILGLSQPGGPAVEAEAKAGDAKRFALPRPLLDRPGCDLSFSGLKTAVLRTRDTLVAEAGGLTVQDRADICAGFQIAVRDVLAEKSRRALAGQTGLTGFAVAGGVAANQTLRAALEAVAAEADLSFIAPPLALCTDNAAMIAYAGLEAYRAGRRDGMDLAARPRWPLDTSRPALLGSGKKGAKA